MQRVFKLGAMVALLVAGLSAPAHALVISPTLSITQGDKLFNNFTCSVVATGGAFGTCDGVSVTGATDQFGNFGLIFQLAAGVTTLNSSLDFLITYDAFVQDPNYVISDVHLTYNGSFTGSGSTSVTETITSLIPLGGIIGQAQVTNPPQVLDHTILLSSTATKISVTKDILLQVGGATGTAQISSIGQYLSQTPEPGSMALLGTAFFGWGVAMRRRRKGNA